MLAVQLAATHCSAAGKHMYCHRKMLSTKLAATVLLALLTFFHVGSADRPANRETQARQQQDRDRNSGMAGIDTGTPGANSIGGDEAKPMPSFEFPTGATGSTG